MSIIFQSESNECGLACIAISLSILGCHVDLSELRRKYQVSSRGMTVKELVEVSSSQRLVARAVRCELDELSGLKCPAILHWGLNHFVVLERMKGKNAIINDPATGRIQVNLNEISKKFTGVAVELSPATDFQKRKSKSPLSLWSWFQLPKSLFGSLTQIFLLSLLLQTYIVAGPFYMQLAIDQAALKGDKQFLITLAIGFGLFAIFNLCAKLFRGWITLKLTALLNWDMTIRLFRHLVRLPLPWFQRRKLADVLSRFDAITPVRNLISGSLVATVVDGILSIVTLIMMLIYAKELAFVVVLGVVLYVIIRCVMLPMSLRLSMESLMAQISENGKRIETIRAIQTIKVMGAENAREGDWANKFSNVIKSDFIYNKFNLIIGSAHELISASVNLILIFLGAKAVMDGNMTVGVLYAFMAYASQFSERAKALFDQYINWRLTDMYSYRLADIVLTPIEEKIDEISIGQPQIEGGLEICNVGFSFAPQETPIFRNINFTVAPGEYIAIVGPSGAGKSTLLKILCGLYTPSAGEVRLDGRSLKSWGPKEVRKVLGVVMQDDELLFGTIAENVAFFDESIDIDWVWNCLQQASLDEDVLRMPMRLDTFLGDMGATLSGGQKQRLLLARALYRRPRILILDEATSHLDIFRESQINESLKKLSITRIIVAHRQETILSADRIISIDEGTIVPNKRYEEIKRTSSIWVPERIF